MRRRPAPYWTVTVGNRYSQATTLGRYQRQSAGRRRAESAQRQEQETVWLVRWRPLYVPFCDAWSHMGQLAAAYRPDGTLEEERLLPLDDPIYRPSVPDDD